MACDCCDSLRDTIGLALAYGDIQLAAKKRREFAQHKRRAHKA
jgi:ribosome maturation protein Sdo1